MSRLAEALLRRRLVALDALDRPAPLHRHRDEAWLDADEGVTALEAEALQRGFVFSAALHRALRALAPGRLTAVGRWLLERLDVELGADAEHVPLFRRFPHTVPANTLAYYVDRVFTLIAQEPDQPCVLCGSIGAVHPVKPCAHLVCRSCWDGSDFSGCPICHRRLDLDDPFLVIEPADIPAPRNGGGNGVRRLTVLAPAAALDLAAEAAALDLLRRPAPLAPAEREDLATLLAATTGVEWLPDDISVRETKAVALAHLLPRSPSTLLDRYVDTATDVLRLLYARMGADPGLRRRPVRHSSIPRPLRRALLARLDAMDLPTLAEDMARHAGAWKRMGEVLHPGEFAARSPRAALGFAIVRGSTLTPALEAEADRHPSAVLVRRGRAHLVTFGARVEAALEDGDFAAAATLLQRRPGELIRRLVHLAKGCPPQVLLSAVRAVISRVSPTVIVAALGQLRTPPGSTRLFLPSSASALTHVAGDSSPALPADLVTDLVAELTSELLRRAAAAPALDRVLLDDGLAALLAPTSDRTASNALIRMTRGSAQPLPEADRLRFFLHWMEPPDRDVDLDLTIAVFDDRWRSLGWCSWTNLRLGNDVLVHSGDLTSAPEPLGASEFIDVDVPGLRDLGGRYLLPIVFSYNNVPFEELTRGFTGFMGMARDTAGAVFDPLAVEQRFDLAGSAKVLLLFVADLWTREFRWADLTVNSVRRTEAHTVEGHGRTLASVAAAVEDVWGLGRRVTLWDVACWSAAARAPEVVVRRTDGSAGVYRRRPSESVADFAGRVHALRPADEERRTGDLGDFDLAVLVRGNVPLPDGASAYALYPGTLDPGRLRMLGAADLLEPFAPAPAAAKVAAHVRSSSSSSS